MPKSLAKVKAIFFDLDQTIVDWKGYKEAAINNSASAMVDAGLKLPVEDVKKCIDEIYIKKGYEYQRVFDDLLRAMNINPQNRIFNKIKAAGVASYREAKRKYLKVYPDVPLALQHLIEMDYKLGLISDAPPFQGWIRIFELKLDKFFPDDFVYISRWKKASKRPFKLIMKDHELAPNELLMVGDDPRSDIKPANELGIVTALAEYGRVYPIDLNDSLQIPDYHLKSFRELINLLNKK